MTATTTHRGETPFRPKGCRPIKAGGKLIGFVSNTPSDGPLAYYSAYRIKDDGSAGNFGGSGTQAGAIAMVREDHDQRTLPQRPWQVRTKNGSTVIVEAATEAQAWQRARALLRRWANDALEPTDARAADREFDAFEPGPLVIQFGEMKRDAQ